MYSLFEMIYDCLFERSDSALNHFEMIYLLSLWNDISKETVFCTPLACSECLPIESWPNSIGKHPAEKNSLLSFRDDLWLSFRNERQRPQSFWNDVCTVFSKWAIQFCVHFDMIYDCHFEMTAQNFRTEDYFRQEKRPVFSWRKCPPKPHIFVHRFFRSDCPLAAWK